MPQILANNKHNDNNKKGSKNTFDTKNDQVASINMDHNNFMINLDPKSSDEPIIDISAEYFNSWRLVMMIEFIVSTFSLLAYTGNPCRKFNENCLESYVKDIWAYSFLGYLATIAVLRGIVIICVKNWRLHGILAKAFNYISLLVIMLNGLIFLENPHFYNFC